MNEGKQIVFRGGRTKSKLIEGFNEELYIMDVNSQNRKQLTNYPKSDMTAGKFGYKAETPKLHPTENYITYQSKQNGIYSLCAGCIDGQNHRNLTESEEHEGWHDWNPDGKWVLYSGADNAKTDKNSKSPNMNLYRLNLTTNEKKQLTFGENYFTHPLYQPSSN